MLNNNNCSEINSYGNNYYKNCPVAFALNILNRKWLVPIICELNRNSVMRFSELSRSIKGITNMMLAQTLKELQSLGIISRTQYNEMPLRVEYSLTDMGREMYPSILSLSKWSIQLMDDPGSNSVCHYNDCVAQVEHIIHINQDNIQNACLEWDLAYENVYQDLITSTETASLDPIEKIILLINQTFKQTTKGGYEFSRLVTIYYISGEEKSNELLSEERTLYKIFNSLLDEAREQGILTNKLTNDEIIQSSYSFIHGINSYWELEHGSYDIVEKNFNIIAHFFNSFRKR